MVKHILKDGRLVKVVFFRNTRTSPLERARRIVSSHTKSTQDEGVAAKPKLPIVKIGIEARRPQPRLK